MIVNARPSCDPPRNAVALHLVLQRWCCGRRCVAFGPTHAALRAGSPTSFASVAETLSEPRQTLRRLAGLDRSSPDRWVVRLRNPRDRRDSLTIIHHIPTSLAGPRRRRQGADTIVSRASPDAAEEPPTIPATQALPLPAKWRQQALCSAWQLPRTAIVIARAIRNAQLAPQPGLRDLRERC